MLLRPLRAVLWFWFPFSSNILYIFRIIYKLYIGGSKREGFLSEYLYLRAVLTPLLLSEHHKYLLLLSDKFQRILAVWERLVR